MFGVIMSNESHPFTDKLDRFKQRINYSEAVRNITDEQKVVVDWPKVLRELKLPDGTVWSSYDNSSGIENQGHGSISDFFESDKKNIHIDIHVLTGVTNKQVVEKLMVLSSFTSMMDINYEYSQQGPGDFYLYGAHYDSEFGHDTAKCVYRNVIVEITTSDDTDVRPIVELLVNIMSKALVDTNKVPRLKISPLYSAQEIKAGETLWVGITLPIPNNQNDYEVQLQGDPLPDGLEYIDNDDNKYYLKTNKPGVYQFQMWSMDKRTLYVEKVNFKVEVKGKY